MFLSIMQQQQIDVPQNSWLGHTTMAGFGLALFAIAILCIKGNKAGVPMGPWGPMVGVLMNKAVTEPTKRIATKWGGGSEGFDWRSLMSFMVGMWAMTSIVSSTGGFLVNLVDWVQGLLMSMKDFPLISDLGMGGICLLLLFRAMRNTNDDKADLIFGAACGFLFPLGGGGFAELTFKIGQWIPHLMQNPFN